ncbi:MAG: ATP synthase F1 subunit gamma [Raineya sp.]|nr:ATP synthase F1 subunit gamma [Raineya sp.]MDW8297363.1 ATP synthase F1 subunit gamma [Raineya sp.]
MPSLKEIRNRIATVNSTQQITKAMKLVAASKLRKAQEAITQMRPYANSLNKILNNLSANYSGEIESPYLQERPIEKVLLVIHTSDRGLCGSFNSNIQKFAYNIIQTEYAAQAAKGNVHCLCLGKKGRDFFAKKGFHIIGEEFTDIFTRLNFENVKKIGDYILKLYAEAKYDKVILIYNEFKNVITQILRQENFLPLERSTVQVQNQGADYILEPSAEEIIQDLIPYSLKVKLYRAILESNASEQGARMSAMDKATENASELLKQLRLEYNRSRQAAITKEILEIVGGAEALKEG